jgi:hypothetical protein
VNRILEDKHKRSIHVNYLGIAGREGDYIKEGGGCGLGSVWVDVDGGLVEDVTNLEILGCGQLTKLTLI